jgi:hypothetical protein
MEEAGQRPRASLRFTSRRTIEGTPTPVLSSQSTSTNDTQDTAASSGQAPPPQSLFTSPEPPDEDLRTAVLVIEELYPEFVNYCPKCGTCTPVEARRTNITAPASEISAAVAPKYLQRDSYDSISPETPRDLTPSVRSISPKPTPPHRPAAKNENQTETPDGDTRESIPLARATNPKPPSRPPPERPATKNEAPMESLERDKIEPTREDYEQREQEIQHREQEIEQREQEMEQRALEIARREQEIEHEYEHEQYEERDNEQVQRQFPAVAIAWGKFPPGWRMRHQKSEPPQGSAISNLDEGS